MAKEKCTLEELKVQSIVAALDDEQMNQVKGGTAPMRGRFYTYRTRWTAVDVRSEFQDMQTLRPPQAK